MTLIFFQTFMPILISLKLNFSLDWTVKLNIALSLREPLVYRWFANHVSHVTLFREHSDAMPLNNYGRQLTQKLTSLNDKRHTGDPRLKHY